MKLDQDDKIKLSEYVKMIKTYYLVLNMESV